MLHSISKVYTVKIEIVYKTCSKVCQSSITNQKNALYSSSSCRIFKHYLDIVFERRWYTKLKSAIKFVKGLPHMCPCHQPNPKRVSNVHEANNNRTQSLSMSHNHVRHYHTFSIIEYIYCHRVFWMFLGHLNLMQPKFEAGYIHLPP